MTVLEAIAIGGSLTGDPWEVPNLLVGCGAERSARCAGAMICVSGIMPVVFYVQRTIICAVVRALLMALSKLQGPAEIFMESRGLVQAFNDREARLHKVLMSTVQICASKVE